LDSDWLHWSQTGRDASPTEFITAKVFVKYCGPIAGGGGGRELEELVSVPVELVKLAGPLLKVQVKVNGQLFPVQATKAAPFLISVDTGWK
jgi:hypothetical protein